MNRNETPMCMALGGTPTIEVLTFLMSHRDFDYSKTEIANHIDISRQTIHNYTIMGLIREIKWTEGGHRLYDESVFERLSKIMQLKKTKTLTEIRLILSKE